MSEHQRKAAAARSDASVAAETDGRVPISKASLLALSAAYHQWQGAVQAAQAAANDTQAKMAAYVQRLQSELDALGLDTEATAAVPGAEGQRRIQVHIDFRVGVLLLPQPEQQDAAPAPPTPAANGKPAQEAVPDDRPRHHGPASDREHRLRDAACNTRTGPDVSS